MIDRKVKRESFVFYRSFHESIKDLPADTYKLCMTTMVDYALNGNYSIPDGQPFVHMFMQMAKPQIDANNRRYLNGKKGGAPKGNHNNKPKEDSGKVNLELTESQPNVNDNDTDNVNQNTHDNNNGKDKDTRKGKVWEGESYCLPLSSANNSYYQSGADMDTQIPRHINDLPFPSIGDLLNNTQ